MTIKLYNKETKESEIKEVIEYTDHSITEQAGRGIMVTSFDDNWVIKPYDPNQPEEEINE